MRTNNESGQAIIESALIFVVFFFVIIGTIDLGQWLFFNDTLTSRLAVGARYGAVHGCASALATECLPAINMAVYGDPTGAGAPILANLTAASLTANVSTHLGDPLLGAASSLIANEDSQVTLSVADYPVDLLLFPKFHRRASASAPVEWYQCYARCK